MTQELQDSFYRKYRPIQFSDMVGQEHVVKALTRTAETRSFSHAYLFGGMHGSGKTSAARILAATLNCPTPTDGGSRPCGGCDVCKGIHEGHCVDVYEMDGANKRKIEDARKIIETAMYPPQQLARKVYIIDECHALTGEASSALLKTIEEPPPYVTFILCTTDIRKIKATILSRCQRQMFTRIRTDAVAGRLAAVAGRENLKADPLALTAIAKVAKGSMRDAFGYLEQIAVADSGSVTMEGVTAYLGVPDKRIIYHIVSTMIENNPVGVFQDVEQLITSAVDIRYAFHEICEVFRSLLVFHHCGRNTPLLDIMDDEKDILEGMAKRIRVKTLLRIAGQHIGIEKDLSVNLNERFVLEAALIQSLRLIAQEAAEQTKQP